MSDGSPFSGTGPRLSGEQLAAIANELVRIKAEFYGKGPEQAKAYQNDDVLVCVMRGGLTTLERTLLAGGEHDLVRDVRVKFQDQMRSTFERAVARARSLSTRSTSSSCACSASRMDRANSGCPAPAWR